MARVLDVHILSQQPESSRDEEWEKVFLEALKEAKVLIERPEPQVGPDGWPYLFVRTSPQAKEPIVKVLDWLTERGMGLVVNPHKALPDYLLTYGMIWNFKQSGEFLSPVKDVPPGEVHFEKGEKVLAGPPSTEFLPDYVRRVIAEFLGQQGVAEPKVLVISRDQVHFDLCFSLDSLGHPNEEEHKGIAEALSWFLPVHYSIVLVAEKGLPEFTRLMPEV